MFAYPLLALIVMSVWYPMPWVLPTLAAIMVSFALMFYYLVFKCMSGLVRVTVNTDFFVSEVWTSRIVQIASVAVLFMSGDPYTWLATFVAPWVLVNTMSDILATLVNFGLLEIKDKDEDDA